MKGPIRMRVWGFFVFSVSRKALQGLKNKSESGVKGPEAKGPKDDKVGRIDFARDRANGVGVETAKTPSAEWSRTTAALKRVKSRSEIEGRRTRKRDPRKQGRSGGSTTNEQ